MEIKGQVTAALLVVALAGVGCSKRGETSQTKDTEQKDTTKTASMSASSVLPDPKPTDEEGFLADTTPKVAGPVSFADAETAYHAKKFAEATTMFEQYTGQRPDNLFGHYMLGLSAWKSGDLSKSEAAFDKALSIDPDHHKSLVNVSRVLIDQKRYDDALDKLTHAGDLDPRSNEVQRLLGRVYHAQGKTDDAVEAYRRAIELDGTDVWSMNNLGLLFLETKRPEEALPLLSKAVELRKDVPSFHNNLGMALEHTKRFGAAATAYADALTADPDYEKAKQNLARVEGVKKGPEEPFEADAKPVGDAKTAGDEQTASK